MLGPDTKIPNIRTELPGPLARELVESDQLYTSPSYTRFYPLAVARGFGAVIEDLDGNLFLDMTAGIAVCSTGHCHPRVVAAIQQQATQLIHMSGTDFYYGPQRDLARKLAEIAPGDEPKRVYFGNSGAEAIEAALKLARYHTGRQSFIAFWGGFHGRTMGAMSLTGSKLIQRRGFTPLVPGIHHVEYSHAGLDQIEQRLFRHTLPPEDVAAVVVEPIQGEGGYIVPPPDFHPRLKQICERHGILYVADEIQAGMGRTGRMFAIEHWGVVPDIICLAKGIASGMPLGAMIARKGVMNWPSGSHASTYGGNPVCCAAALETLALLETELIENADRMGEVLLSGLRSLQQRHRAIGDVRGKGLMLAFDLARPEVSNEDAASQRDALVEECFHKGLLVLGCGTTAIRLAPPLVISRQQAETAIAILDEVLGRIHLD
jgi:4-aminobutyrate aminotransferase